MNIDGTVSESVAVILLRLAPINELGSVFAILWRTVGGIYARSWSRGHKTNLTLVFAEARMILSCFG